jgi:hypothetical protein
MTTQLSRRLMMQLFASAAAGAVVPLAPSPTSDPPIDNVLQIVVFNEWRDFALLESIEPRFQYVDHYNDRLGAFDKRIITDRQLLGHVYTDKPSHSMHLNAAAPHSTTNLGKWQFKHKDLTISGSCLTIERVEFSIMDEEVITRGVVNFGRDATFVVAS